LVSKKTSVGRGERKFVFLEKEKKKKKKAYKKGGKNGTT